MGANNIDTWADPSRVDKLKERWLAGRSATQIGHEMGLTRNQVIGKINRLGLVRARAANDGGQALQMQGRRPFEWTRIADNKLKGLSRQGVTRVHAAATLGCSCDVMARRIKRLGLTWVNPLPPEKPVKPSPKERTPWISSPPGPELEARREEFARSGKRRIEAFAVPANDDSIPMMERRFGQCAWPVGVPARPADQMCCGHRTASGSSYCTQHRRLATTGQSVSAEDLIRSVRRVA